jgi:hypothetical protein
MRQIHTHIPRATKIHMSCAPPLFWHVRVCSNPQKYRTVEKMAHSVAKKDLGDVPYAIDFGKVKYNPLVI